MPGSSPPTRRVVEIIELLTKRAGLPTRLSDIVKTLGLNQATAYTIMKELVDTGWVTRDPVDKTFSIGGTLVSLARRFDQSPSVAHAVHAAAQAAAADTGYAASVSERTGNQLVITAFINLRTGRDDQWHAAVGDRLPFAAPFGPVFAAWEPDAERRAWIQRSGVNSRAFQVQLEQFLDETVSQGFSVERMSPEMVSAIPLMTKLQAAALSGFHARTPWRGAARNDRHPKGLQLIHAVNSDTTSARLAHRSSTPSAASRTTSACTHLPTCLLERSDKQDAGCAGPPKQSPRP